MKLKVIGSGSSGNCYILENETECLVIEAGLPLMEVKRATGYNIKKIVGVVASHTHQDHSKYLNQYLGIAPIYKPYELITPDMTFGRFKVRAFKLVHDVECYGFYITHPDIGSLLYASDTEYIKYRFKGINHMLVEANYSEDLIDNDAINREHILRGHMSLETCHRFIQTNDNPMLKDIVLIHLSDKNADSATFLQKTKEITDKEVYIARRGLEVDLNLCPF